MKKVLLITVNSLTRNGINKFLEDWIDESKESCSYTWYCGGKNLDDLYKKQFENMGVRVLTGDIEFKKNEKYFRFVRDIKKILNEEYYDIVHINTGVITFAYLAVKIARKKRIKSIIVHSHGSSNAQLNWGGEKVYRHIQKYIRNKATKKVACSVNAAGWMFGNEKYIDSWEYVKNKIDVSCFQFNRMIREKYRSKLGIEDGCMLLGTVGRMNVIKNHIYLLSIMEEISKSNKNIKLVIIGTGVLEEKIKDIIKRKGLEQVVLLLGEQIEVSSWLQAMDVFMMPSLHEGFPIAAIEAQATGLPCLLSSNISKEVAIGSNVQFLELDNLSLWVNTIIRMYRHNTETIKREDAWYIVKMKGFDKGSYNMDVQKLYDLEGI